jgi:hypothetical protein
MKLPFEGAFKAGISYLLSGKTILEWRKNYIADRVLPGRGIDVAGSPHGRVFSVRPSAILPVKELQIVNGSGGGKYRITKGYINLFEPTLNGVKIGGEPDEDPPILPPEFEVTETETHVWMKCVGTFGNPNEHEVSIEIKTLDATPPAGTSITPTGFVAFKYIGKVIFFNLEPPFFYEIHNAHQGGNVRVESFGLYNYWGRE